MQLDRFKPQASGSKHRILFCVIKIQGEKSEVKEDISNMPLYIKPEIAGEAAAIIENHKKVNNMVIFNRFSP